MSNDGKSINQTILEAIGIQAPKFLEGLDAMGQAEGFLVANLAKDRTPTWPVYEERRNAFYAAAPSTMKPETVRKQWSRLCAAAEVVIPKSTDPDAVKKAEAREKQAAQLASIPDAELASKIAAVQAAGEKPARLLAEQKRRQAEKEKPQREALESARKELRDALKECSDVQALKAALAALKAPKAPKASNGRKR